MDKTYGIECALREDFNQASLQLLFERGVQVGFRYRMHGTELSAVEAAACVFRDLSAVPKQELDRADLSFVDAEYEDVGCVLSVGLNRWDDLIVRLYPKLEGGWYCSGEHAELLDLGRYTKLMFAFTHEYILHEVTAWSPQMPFQPKPFVTRG